MIRKWKFALILSLTDKLAVKGLNFERYCMINCGKTGNDISPEFLVFKWLISG